MCVEVFGGNLRSTVSSLVDLLMCVLVNVVVALLERGLFWRGIFLVSRVSPFGHHNRWSSFDVGNVYNGIAAVLCWSVILSLGVVLSWRWWWRWL